MRHLWLSNCLVYVKHISSILNGHSLQEKHIENKLSERLKQFHRKPAEIMPWFRWASTIVLIWLKSVFPPVETTFQEVMKKICFKVSSNPSWHLPPLSISTTVWGATRSLMHPNSGHIDYRWPRGKVWFFPDHSALWTLTKSQMIYTQPKKPTCQVLRLVQTLFGNSEQMHHRCGVGTVTYIQIPTGN